MPLDKAKIDELKANVSLARKRELAFGLCLGKKPDGTVLLCHKSKDPTLLGRLAKKEGETAKVTFGMMECQGSKLILKCQEDPPPGLAKKTRDMFKAAKLKMKVLIQDANGDTLETDSEDEEGDEKVDAQLADDDVEAAHSDTEKDSGTDDRAEDLKAKIKELAVDVKKIAASNKTAASKIVEGLKRASGAVTSGDFDDAGTTLGKIEKALQVAGLTGAAPVDEDGDGGGPSVPGVDLEAMRKAVETAYMDVEDKLSAIKESGKEGASKKAAHLEATYSNFLKSDDFKKAAGLVNLAKTFVEKEYAKLERSTSGLVESLSGMASDAVETVKEVMSDVAEAADDFVDSLTEDGRNKLELQRLGFSEDEQDKIVAALETNPNAMKEAKEKLVDEANVPDAQKAALKKLAAKNPKSFEAAMNTLKELEADGSVEAGPDKIAEGKAAVETAQKADAEKLAAFDVANKALEDLKNGNPAPNSDWAKALAKADAAEKAWKEFNDALPEPASMSESERNEAMVKGMELDRLRKEATQAAEEAKAHDIKAAEEASATAKGEHDAAKQGTKAAADDLKKKEAKRGILDAITAGPLSPNHGAPFDDVVSAKFIEGFQKDPNLTAKAIEAATGARHPEAVANALDGIADKLSAGFADKDGKTLPDTEDPRAYAEKLIESGAYCGPEYFDRLDAYVASGAHLQSSGFKEDPADKSNVRAQKRSVATASALLDGDGKLDVESESAQKAVGNLLFHPDAMKQPMPTMSDTTLRTLEELKKPKASEIINGMTKPVVGGGAAELVGRAVNATGEVSAEDAKTAVLATMMKSLDQGPVGSCFSTAPSRNLREGQPLVAMEKFAEIASTGKLTTAKGPKTSVITETPPGEDPIMRSLEYTLATALARNESSSQNKRIKGRNLDGAQAIRGDIGTAMGLVEPELGKKVAKILRQLKSGFEIKYDPTIENEDVAEDGSSKFGRHVLVDKASGTVISSRDEYVAAVTPMVLKALGLEDDSDAAKALKPKIAAEFVDATVTTKSVAKPDGSTENVVHRAPWKMVSGGQTGEAVEQLFGETDYNVALAENYDIVNGKKIPKSNTRAKQGARTAQVLEDLVGTFGSDPADMIVIRTVGIHGFNAMPNDPSLKPILEGEGTVEDRIKSTLIDPGAKIAAEDMSVEQTQKYYDDTVAASRKHIERWIRDASTPPKKQQFEGFLTDYDTAAKDNRPTEGKTPAELADLIKTVRTAGHFAKPDAGRDALAAEMVAGLGAPEVVIADTNWGDSTYHVYIVAAPDPMSGEVILWKKYDPPGTRRILEPKWIDASWASMIPKN